MNEEVSIIDSKTRNERIKDFFQKNKKTLIFTIVIFIVSLISFYTFQIFKDKKKVLISNKYNTAIIEYNDLNKAQTTSDLIDVIDDQDSTYSPLALYFIIDNNLIDDRAKINELFDILINIRSLESEIKNLIIYKKGLFNADHVSESQILKILNPIINSGSVWKSHALYLVAEYFYSKNEKQKSKEFYDQILLTENANQEIRKEAQKRLNRDLSD